MELYSVSWFFVRCILLLLHPCNSARGKQRVSERVKQQEALQVISQRWFWTKKRKKKKGKKSLNMAMVVSFGWGSWAVVLITKRLGRSWTSAVYMTLNPVRHLSWWAGGALRGRLNCSHKVIRCMQSSVGSSSRKLFGDNVGIGGRPWVFSLHFLPLRE